MKKEYRIVKKYHRNDETGAVESAYHIEVLKKVWGLKSLIHWGRYLKWVQYYHSEIYHPIHGMFRTDAVFDSAKAAKKYLHNLRQPIHTDEVVS